MGDNSEQKRLVNSWQRDLNKIIGGWDLIPGSPFDALNHKLIGHLTRGSNKEKIHEVLKSELIVRYGLSPTGNDLEQFAIEIIDWWIKRNGT